MYGRHHYTNSIKIKHLIIKLANINKLLLQIILLRNVDKLVGKQILYVLPIHLRN